MDYIGVVNPTNCCYFTDEIIAIEPHDGMREVLEAKKLPGVRVVKGMGDSMPSVADESVDAVTVAQVGHLRPGLAIPRFLLDVYENA